MHVQPHREPTQTAARFRWRRTLDKGADRRTVESKQYLSIRNTDRLAAAGGEQSVGNVGDPYDDALAESIIGLFRAEVIWRRGPWRGLEALDFATLEWVDWFSHRRLLEPIGNMPPAEAEARFQKHEEVTVRAA